MRKASKRTAGKLRKPSKKTLKFFRKIVRKIAPRKTTRRRKKIILQKSATPTLVHPASPEASQLIGKNKLVLLVRDPWWLFAYWELAPGGEGANKKILRVYDITRANVSGAPVFFDIEFGLAGSWYVEVGMPDHEWVAEIGELSRDGRFTAEVRSNMVRTPRFGVSDVTDEEWALTDELLKKLYDLAGAAESFSSQIS